MLTELMTRGCEREGKQTVPPSLMTPFLWTVTESNRRHKDFQSQRVRYSRAIKCKMPTFVGVPNRICQ
jgi:hypothetical protein